MSSNPELHAGRISIIFSPTRPQPLIPKGKLPKYISEAKACCAKGRRICHFTFVLLSKQTTPLTTTDAYTRMSRTRPNGHDFENTCISHSVISSAVQDKH
jgi:hypothetical protein